MKTKFNINSVTQKIFLFLIIIFSLFIRLYQLDTLPPALYYDELDASFQAKTFNENQTDYYGHKLPFAFQSFGDYRTPLHIYSIALIHKFTPNPDIAARLPSVIYGVISIYLMYLISGSLIPTLLLAISPWAIHYSRISFEVSGMLSTLLAGVYFWKRYIKNSRLIDLLFSAFFLCLSPYFYSTSKLFLLILVILIFIIWFPKIIKTNKIHLFLAAILSLTLLLPFLIDTLKGSSSFRFSYIGIFTDPQISKTVDYQRYADVFTTHQNETGVSPSIFSKLIHNKYTLVATTFIKNYFSAFSTDFLFINGDKNLRHGFGAHGLLYFVDFFLIILGLFNVIKNRHQDKIGSLFVWVLLFAPLPFSLTRDSLGPHATRLILMLPSLIYLSYQGILYLIYSYKWSIFVVVLLYLLSFLDFSHYYRFDYPQDSALAWQSGMKEAILFSNEYQDQTLVFSESYISFVSFFLSYYPYHLPKGDSINTHLVKVNNRSISGQKLDNRFYFGRINWSNLNDFPEGTIYIIPNSEINQVPSSLKILKSIEKKYINSEGFSLYTNEVKN